MQVIRQQLSGSTGRFILLLKVKAKAKSPVFKSTAVQLLSIILPRLMETMVKSLDKIKKENGKSEFSIAL